VFESVCVTDTIPLGDEWADVSRVKVISVDSLFAEAIRAIHFNDSVSRLFLKR
jgi:ribose-phosphate pyrophosphokinase